MNIVVEFSDIDQKRELSITDGTVTINKKNCFMMNQEMLHNWITQSFDTWLILKENQKRVEGDEDGLTVYATTDKETLEWLRGQKEKGDEVKEGE
jgi:hypothetical protein